MIALKNRTLSILVAGLFIIIGLIVVAINIFVLHTGTVSADIMFAPYVGDSHILYVAKDKKAFLSPDRKYLAITYTEDEIVTKTYIADIKGNQVASPQTGSFIAWSPDSSAALLYLPIEATGAERRLYYLALDGTYRDSELPAGVISADISPHSGSIIYSLTDSKTDDSNLYLRDAAGKDTLILPGDKNIYTWVRWSPDGEQIAFLKSDLRLVGDKNEIWVMRADGSEARSVSGVAWSYPPVWSSESTRLVFSNKGRIWEYNVNEKTLKQVSNLQTLSAQHPSYSGDSGAVIFSDGQQIWAIEGGVERRLTSNNEIKLYPIVP